MLPLVPCLTVRTPPSGGSAFLRVPVESLAARPKRLRVCTPGVYNSPLLELFLKLVDMLNTSKAEQKTASSGPQHFHVHNEKVHRAYDSNDAVSRSGLQGDPPIGPAELRGVG